MAQTALMQQQTPAQSAGRGGRRHRGFPGSRLKRVNWWLTATVAVLSLTILVPLYFTVVPALKTPAEAGTFSLPSSWQWHNFADARKKINYPKAALNSANVTV